MYCTHVVEYNLLIWSTICFINSYRRPPRAPGWKDCGRSYGFVSYSVSFNLSFDFFKTWNFSFLSSNTNSKNCKLKNYQQKMACVCFNVFNFLKKEKQYKEYNLLHVYKCEIAVLFFYRTSQIYVTLTYLNITF